MEENFEVMAEIKRIEGLFLELFRKEGAKELIDLEWKYIKNEYDFMPKRMDIASRLLIEDLIIFYIASDEKKGYERIIQAKEISKISIKIETYEELEERYEKYISVLRKHLKNNSN